MRCSPDLSQECALWAAGVVHAAGVDEAGRGAWAGPVSAGAVILPPDPAVLERLVGVRDSKQMTARQRGAWAEHIRKEAAAWGVGFASAVEIDALGILPATRLAMQRALAALNIPPQHLLIDAVRLRSVPLPQTCLIRGDATCLSIAAASVLAKTARDALLTALETEFPGYGFAQHKGYGTEEHREAILKLGRSAVHRDSFLRKLYAQPRDLEGQMILFD